MYGLYWLCGKECAIGRGLCFIESEIFVYRFLRQVYAADIKEIYESASHFKRPHKKQTKTARAPKPRRTVLARSPDLCHGSVTFVYAYKGLSKAEPTESNVGGLSSRSRT